MTTPPATRIVVLTPEGRGAVASILVEGPLAVAAVAERFYAASGRPLVRQPCGRIALGRWGSQETGEEVVVCRRDRQRVEVHCHGGHVATAAITRSLVESGCREVAWQDWARESETSPIASAARIALAAAPTQRVAGILWDQYCGALDLALEALATEIASGHAAAAQAMLDGLMNRSALGLHLISPWQVVFAGRPNVGKSSLINALVGYQRAIVHDTPGTTRDVVTATSALDGWPVELADTAGLRSTGVALEAAGIRLAQDRLATADLVVLVFDASARRTDEERSLRESWPLALQVYNKCDLMADSVLPSGEVAGEITTSATERVGIDELGREIGRRLVPQPPATGEAVPFTAEQIELLAQVRTALLAGEVAGAGRLLKSGSPGTP